MMDMLYGSPGVYEHSPGLLKQITTWSDAGSTTTSLRGETFSSARPFCCQTYALESRVMFELKPNTVPMSNYVVDTDTYSREQQICVRGDVIIIIIIKFNL